MVWIEKYVELFDGNWQLATLATVFACLLVLGIGAFLKIIYAIVGFFITIKRLFRQRKRQRAQEKRDLEFTLPERGNAYLRARLHTSLNPDFALFNDEQEPPSARLGYAKKLLSCVQGAPLTPTERLEVEEMMGLLVAFTQKNGWTGTERKAVNDVLSKLIKLSAKYDVAV